MRLLQDNHAYIDGANLYRGAKSLGWKLDYGRLRVWLREKYRVSHAYIFIGYIKDNEELYEQLRQYGYTLIFKETVELADRQIKGNCDADLVLKVACDTYEGMYDEAVIISSDGDYASLVKFLHDNKRLCLLLSPSNRCSSLLLRLNIPLEYLRSIRSSVEEA